MFLPLSLLSLVSTNSAQAILDPGRDDRRGRLDRPQIP